MNNWVSIASLSKSTPLTRHVIVIGVDGLSPAGIRASRTPVLDEMMKNGTVKWNVRTVLPSASSQNWASMLMGAGPEQHGIIDNDWEIDDHSLPPIVQEADGRFPTIFSVIKKQKSGSKIGVVYNWKGFGRLFQKSAVDYDRQFSTEDSTIADFTAYIQREKPALGFVHLDHVDHAGHHEGHGSAAYVESIEKTDRLIGEVLSAIKKAGIAKETVVIVWSDHGGIGTGHGGATPEEAEIAGVFYGQNVKQGYIVKHPVYTYDLAPTIAWLLGVETPYAWIGRAINAAFQGNPEPKNHWAGQEVLEKPVLYPLTNVNAPSGDLYIDKPARVEIRSKQKGGEIRYTLDSSIPDQTSPVYTEPFDVTRTTIVRAKYFHRKGNSSGIATGFYRVVDSKNSNGLQVRFYPMGRQNKMPVFAQLQSTGFWKSAEVTLDSRQIGRLLPGSTATFAVEMEGYIEIAVAGKYNFFTRSDDGSKLFIDGQEVVNNDGNHTVEEKKGAVTLASGLHSIRIEYYNNGGGYWLDAWYKPPGGVKQWIPANVLFSTR